MRPGGPRCPARQEGRRWQRYHQPSGRPRSQGTVRQGRCPPRAKPKVTAGFMWAPETWPRAKMMTATARPVESPIPRWVICPPEISLAMMTPVATKTSRKVPTNSAARGLREKAFGMLGLAASVGLPVWIRERSVIRDVRAFCFSDSRKQRIPVVDWGTLRGRLMKSCPAWIRTRVSGSKVRCATAAPPGNEKATGRRPKG